MLGQTERFNRRLLYGRGDDNPVIAWIIRDLIRMPRRPRGTIFEIMSCLITDASAEAT
jgi:hypothetical protein